MQLLLYFTVSELYHYSIFTETEDFSGFYFTQTISSRNQHCSVLAEQRSTLRKLYESFSKIFSVINAVKSEVNTIKRKHR